MSKSENDQNTGDGSVESSDLLDDLLAEWDVGADGIPVRKGDQVSEEDGELFYLHKDGRKTHFD